MADEQNTETEAQEVNLNLEGDDNAPFEELGIDIDQINREVSQISPQKVELDTTGLDLEIDEASEPEAEADQPEEEPEEDEEPEAESGRPGWFWPVIMGGSGVVIALLVVVIGYFTWWAPKPEVAVEVEEKTVVQSVEELPVGVPLLALPEFSIPLKTEAKTLLRISIHLALNSESAKALLLGQSTKVRDAIYGSLLKLAQGELKTTEQRLALREELLSSLNRTFPGSPVKEIYFTQFFIL